MSSVYLPAMAAVAPSNAYHFVSTWHLRGTTCNEVSEILGEAAYCGEYGLLVAGTAISNHFDSGSDIDMFVVHQASWRQRWCSRSGELRADITLLSATEVRAAYGSVQNPGVLDAFAHGLVLADFGRTVFLLQLEAARMFAAGAPPLQAGTVARKPEPRARATMEMTPGPGTAMAMA